MNPLDWLKETDFWEWVGLIAVIAIFLWWRVLTFIGSALDRRADAISRELDTVKRLREEAETVLVNYRERARGAEGEAATILNETRAETERFTAEARAQMQAQIERRGSRDADRCPPRRRKSRVPHHAEHRRTSGQAELNTAHPQLVRSRQTAISRPISTTFSAGSRK
jgi:uncharacterized protein YfcZ (UPF0381/DUF406 family)